MFAIYNNGSVSFRSTADNLYQVKNTDAPHKVLLKPDDDDLYQDYLDREKKNKKNQENEQPNQKELNAYKKIANMDTTSVVYHVKDIMSANCIAINQSSSILEAYNLLREKKVSQIPVVFPDGKIVGMINKKIILNLLMDDFDRGRHILNQKLSELYFDDLLTTDPISDIRRVAKVMLDFKLDAIPVVDSKDVLCGIVSKTDIIKAVSKLPAINLWG